jgi:putative hydrolase of the HAD superfamily
MLKAVLFDMDDTLLDWSQRSQDWQEFEREHLSLVFDYVAREVHPVRTPESFFEAFRHMTRSAWLEAEQGLRAPHLGAVLCSALEHIGVPRDVINVEACLRAYNWGLIGGVCAFPDAIEVLPTLVAHHIKIGLITNASAPMWMRDLELDQCGLLSYFADCRITAADVGYIKPHPLIFEKALDCLDVRAEEAVFVGDDPHADVGGAQNVGMKAVLRTGLRSEANDGSIEPDALINTLHDLLPILDQWYPDWRVSSDTSITRDVIGDAG